SGGNVDYARAKRGDVVNEFDLVAVPEIIIVDDVVEASACIHRLLHAEIAVMHKDVAYAPFAKQTLVFGFVLMDLKYGDAALAQLVGDGAPGRDGDDDHTHAALLQTDTKIEHD